MPTGWPSGVGRPYNYPDSSRRYAENFLYMLDYMNQRDYEVSPVAARALDILFLLHADHDLFEVTGSNRLIDIAMELERIAFEDDFFVSRKLYPNVDFYSGLIMQALRFPTEMFPVLFAIPRSAGWLDHWLEMIQDPEQRIAKPRQVYIGADNRDYVPADDR